MRTAPNQYDHPSAGLLTAVTADEYPAPVPAMADWVVTNPRGRVVGYITDSRADGGQLPSPGAPADEYATPFESYDLHGQQITCTHSIRGALLAVGNRAK